MGSGSVLSWLYLDINQLSLSECIAINNVSISDVGPINWGISLEPNPTNGDFEIVVADVHNSLAFEIIDAKGRLVQEVLVDGNSTAQVKLEGDPGVYLVRSLTAFGWYTERIVKL